MSLHSVLSPSGADRWSTCVGSLAACKGSPPSPNTAASLLGSAKHAISEMLLRKGDAYMADTLVGQIWYLSADGKDLEVNKSPGCYEFTIDDTFADHVNVYVNYVRSRPGTKKYEVRLSTAHIFGVEGQGGTADCEHLDFVAREIEIIDAKFGYVPVSAEHKQLRIYGGASLTLHDLEGDWDTVRTTIVQPQDFAEPIKTHVYTRAEIEAFCAEIRPKAQTAHVLFLSPPPDLLRHLTPSDEACAWCPIAGSCAARSKSIVDLFEDVTAVTPDTVLLTDARLALLYAQSADIVEWAQGIAAEAEARALRGIKLPDYKLIYGRKGNRVFDKDQTEAIEGVLSMALGAEDMYQPRKLLSPTAVEAALKKAKAPNLYEMVKPFVTQAEPRLRLVPESTAGDAVSVAPVSFDAL